MKTASLVLAIVWLILSILNMSDDNETWAAADIVISGVWCAAWYVMLYIDENKKRNE